MFVCVCTCMYTFVSLFGCACVSFASTMYTAVTNSSCFRYNVISTGFLGCMKDMHLGPKTVNLLDGSGVVVGIHVGCNLQVSICQSVFA